MLFDIYTMGLDIVLFRTEEGREQALASQKARYEDLDQIQVTVTLDEAHRAAAYELTQINTQLNTKSRSIGIILKDIKSGKVSKEDGTSEIEKIKLEVRKLKERAASLKGRVTSLKMMRERTLNSIGNLVHPTVPVSDNEKHNRQEKVWGERRMEDNLRSYDQILQMIGGVDMARGSKVAGQRCYFLTGIGVRLNLALVQYGLDFLTREELGADKYTEMSCPFFMDADTMAKTAQLEQFDEELYTVLETSRTTDALPNADEEKERKTRKKYLIATSEQPLSAYHMDEWILEKDLPLRYAGQSTCFRKEAGSAKDVRGIFRVHQFDKIEQFCITTPEKSWEEHERMLLTRLRRTSKPKDLFYQSLGLPYQVVSIVSGKLNKSASKKLDLEAWFPQQQAYRELVSCSNCTDYQSRALGIRLLEALDDTNTSNKRADQMEKREKRYVHMLNSTLVATTRTICCILEVYQTPDGVNVPEVLQPYLRGLTFIPFIDSPCGANDDKPAAAQP